MRAKGQCAQHQDAPAELEALELYAIAIISKFSSGEVYKTRKSVITIEIYLEF